MKELIKYKGFQVAPAELESLINSHPAVYECIVIPVLREDAGEIPRTYVVLKPNVASVTEAEIVAFVTEKVSPHKKLRGGVKFVNKIPKSASGKLLRRVQIEIDRGVKPPLE
jgi:acyl-coenzyme A synthetase/AMP-(fatty) acid ligase